MSDDKNSNKNPMEKGDKYITLHLGDIKLSDLISAVLEKKSIPLWPNKDRKGPNSPNFRGHGIAAWVNEYNGEQQHKAEFKNAL